MDKEHASASEPVKRQQYVDLNQAFKIAAMLDISFEQVEQLENLPCGWHFPLLGAATPRHHIRKDGFPGFGVPMPAFDLPRLLMTGRSVNYFKPIPFFTFIDCESRVSSINEKESNGSRRVFVTLSHELYLSDSKECCLIEDQKFVMLSDEGRAPPKGKRASEEYSARVTLTPDSIMLFQYSALGFNSHKIHLDRQYSQEIEKLPDLVVNGGLVILLIKEFLKNSLNTYPSTFNSNHFLPLYCNNPLTISGQVKGDEWLVEVIDYNGFIAASAKGKA